MFSLEQTHFWFAGKRAFLHRAASRIPIKGKILDIGSGTGGTTVELAKFGPVEGLEINPTARMYARRRGLQIHKGTANKLPFRAASFALVTLLDVLYHKNIDETKTLTEAYRVLAPGGSLIVMDCAQPWLWSQHDESWDAKYRYTKNHLRTLVTEAGFHVDACYYLYTSVFPLTVVSRLFTVSTWNRLPPRWLNKLLTVLLTLESKLPIWFPRMWGSSLLLTAHRS